jgi:pyruvate formate lyase activating enzyme
MGKSWALDDLTTEVLKDRAYFETSGGGITVSGGEPTLQAGFAGQFLKALRQKGIHTALDTCGLCRQSALDQVLPYSALVLFDVKLMDPAAHKKFTGHDNHRILENLVYVSDYMRSHVHPSELWIRTPLIPETTAAPENMAAIGQFIATRLNGAVSRWELCAFNNLCRDKYIRLGQPWAFENEKLLSYDFLEEMEQAAKGSGVDPDMVVATGATRLE